MPPLLQKWIFNIYKSILSTMKQTILQDRQSSTKGYSVCFFFLKIIIVLKVRLFDTKSLKRIKKHKATGASEFQVTNVMIAAVTI